MKDFEDFYNKIRLEYDEITKESAEKSIKKCEEIESMSCDEADEDEKRSSCLEASAIFLAVMEILKRYHGWESENQQDQEPEKLSDKDIFDACQREAKKYSKKTGRTPLD